MSTNRFNHINPDNLSEELESRIRRISGGSALLNVKDKIKAAITDGSVELWESVKEALGKIHQPTTGRQQIVEDVNGIIDYVIDGLSSGKKKAKKAKEVVKKAVEKVTQEVKADLEDASSIVAEEDIKQVGDSFSGDPVIVSEELLAMNPALESWIDADGQIYVDGDTVTAVVLDQDDEELGYQEGDVYVLETKIPFVTK